MFKNFFFLQYIFLLAVENTLSVNCKINLRASLEMIDYSWFSPTYQRVFVNENLSHAPLT